MNKASLSAALAALMITAATLGACGGPATPEEPPLANAKIGGPFTLIDQDGRKVSDTDFAGKYRLVYFGYTFCPDICPVDVQTLMKGFRDLEAKQPELAAKIQPIFITIDPARDDPAAVKQFVRSFHPRLIGLTGTEAEIAAVAKEYAIFFTKVPKKKADDDPRSQAQFDADEKNSYLMDHSRQAFLFDPNGKPLALITQDKGPEAVVSDIERWAK